MAFQPTDIANCVAWYQSGNISALNGANISSWADDAGTNDLSLGIGNPPKYYSNVHHGNPSVRWDGSANSSFVSVANSSLNGDEFTFFSVSRFSNIYTFSPLIQCVDSFSNKEVFGDRFE